LTTALLTATSAAFLPRFNQPSVCYDLWSDALLLAVPLQAGRSHMKQLMSDLETEQERTAGLTSDLTKARDATEESAAARAIAEGRMKTLQGQLSKANDSSAALSDKLQEVQAKLEVCVRSLCSPAAAAGRVAARW
jgi:septal ring factor EnvC (AmiA/AmiB activator)